MPAPQTISIDLTQAETDIVWNHVQTYYPGLTGQQVLNKLSKIGRDAIKDFVVSDIRRMREEESWAQQASVNEVFDPVEPATPAEPATP